MEQAQGATVVGHSTGGLGALMMLAYDEPALVGRLPLLAEMLLPGATPEQAAAQASRLAQRMRSLPDEAYRARQDMTLTTYTKSPSFLSTLQAWSNASDRATATTAFQEALATDFRPALPDIAQPVLVLAA